MNGMSYSNIAGKFGISKAAISRHASHRQVVSAIVPSVSNVVAPLESRHGSTHENSSPDVYDRVVGLANDCERVIDAAYAKGDSNLILRAMEQARRTYEAMMKVQEWQERFKPSHDKDESFTASFVHGFLKERYPGVLAELATAVKEQRRIEQRP